MRIPALSCLIPTPVSRCASAMWRNRRITVLSVLWGASAALLIMMLIRAFEPLPPLPKVDGETGENPDDSTLPLDQTF